MTISNLCFELKSLSMCHWSNNNVRMGETIDKIYVKLFNQHIDESSASHMGSNFVEDTMIELMPWFGNNLPTSQLNNDSLFIPC